MGDFDTTRSGPGIITAPAFEPYAPSPEALDAQKLHKLLQPAFEAAGTSLQNVSMREVPASPREEDGSVMRIELNYDHTALTNALKKTDQRFPVLIEHAIGKQLDGNDKITLIENATRPGHMVLSFTGTLAQLTGDEEVAKQRAQAIAGIVDNRKNVVHSLKVQPSGGREL